MNWDNRISREEIELECLLTLGQVISALKHLGFKDEEKISVSTIRTYNSRGILERPRLGPPYGNVNLGRFNSYYKPSVVLAIIDIKNKLSERWTINEMRNKTAPNALLYTKIRLIDQEIINAAIAFGPMLITGPKKHGLRPGEYQKRSVALGKLVKEKLKFESDLENNQFGGDIEPHYKTMLVEFLQKEFGKDCSKSLENT